MKSPFALCATAALLLTGCGQPGPLYMPRPPTPAAAAATPPPAPPAPSTPATGAGSNANNTQATDQPLPAVQTAPQQPPKQQ